MAKRSYSRKGNKIQPAEQTLTFVQEETGAATIDTSQCASLVNRRFYRQGINWAVAGFKFSSTSPGRINVSKLPNTWVMSNAWEKSFRTWTKMNNMAMEETESIRPKFLDFKVYADSLHHTAGYNANLLPISLTSGNAVAGEWVSSKAVVPFGPASPGNTVEFEFVATGQNFPGISPATGHNAVSLIEGYAASRGLPYSPDPNTPADADDADGSTPENWMAAIFNEGTDQDSEVIENLRTDNNEAPYPFSGDAVGTPDTMYPGGANQLVGLHWHDFSQIFSTSATTNVGITTAKGGNFPCGLIRIDWVPETPGAELVIQVDLVPGNHRGYLCEPMTEM